MLLPTMNSEELYSEILRDYPTVLKKGMYELEKLRRPAIKSKDKHVQRFYDYRTKNNNNWIIMCDYYIKDPSCVVVVHYLDEYGLQTFMVDAYQKSLTHYSGHFLERFNQRYLQEPELSKLDLLKRFLSKNATAHLKFLPDREKYQNPFFGRFREGIGLGFVEKLKMNHISHFKTYLSNDMIFESQQESFDYAGEKYKEYWDETYKNRNIGAFD